MKAERKLKATDLGTKVCKDLAFLFTAHPPCVPPARRPRAREPCSCPPWE